MWARNTAVLPLITRLWATQEPGSASLIPPAPRPDLTRYSKQLRLDSWPLPSSWFKVSDNNLNIWSWLELLLENP